MSSSTHSQGTGRNPKAQSSDFTFGSFDSSSSSNSTPSIAPPQGYSTPTTSITSEAAMRSRFLFLLQRILNRQVTVTLKDGNKFDGTFFTATPFSSQSYEIVLKQLVPYPENTATTVSPGSTIRIPFNQVRHLHVLPFVVERASDARRTDGKVGISTDAELSKQRSQGGGPRQLVQEGGSWFEGNEGGQSGGGNMDLRRGDIGSWDQFAENERRFGVQNTFDEEMYTSKLDRSKLSQEEQDRADELAEKILSSSSSSSSSSSDPREEQSNKDENDEMLFSGVIRDPEEKQEQGEEKKEEGKETKKSSFQFNPNALEWKPPSFSSPQPQQQQQQQPQSVSQTPSYQNTYTTYPQQQQQQTGYPSTYGYQQQQQQYGQQSYYPQQQPQQQQQYYNGTQGYGTAIGGYSSAPQTYEQQQLGYNQGYANTYTQNYATQGYPQQQQPQQPPHQYYN